MNVAEAADQLGVSPRRVRALIAAGRVNAAKVGTSWQVETLPDGRRHRRPLSVRSRRMLVHALHYRTLTGLSGTDRSRTAARIRALRTADDPSALLADWWGGAPDHDGGLFETHLIANAVAGNTEYIRYSVSQHHYEYLRDPDDLADVVATERTIRGWSVRRLADSADIDPAAVRLIERAEQAPLSAVRRTLRALDIEPTALPDLRIAP
ncbi:helix-turn-helix domain-containing protein [Gordonia sp. (in: high G+C Gram-positive bacteria)]|jgi:excisionase family DNA binding protein|uniref:helix-turn-helix domain-containing protein n=1 Tax=Gordonia sp. (in: high G+C Gram-positive bacteria) TaxID=84139 RepID=UPI001DD78A86|nr:helix-turn-helix domain-containing protein [Gordonia sp. (in: high G+C Gram-positive bacteria)]MCB1294471.1 hypothetical protein [Gordonia sp. (in: high G+C Gram-positive bacteria)]HMS77469.1 hypothetical protein [Gordonia sp. (in: high G+C Gram-positive bacteria)]HQV18182.1 hypothetical protein [Gordonia sp. (in: high G+C Gram-positive bacteria)]